MIFDNFHRVEKILNFDFFRALHHLPHSSTALDHDKSTNLLFHEYQVQGGVQEPERLQGDGGDRFRQGER